MYINKDKINGISLPTMIICSIDCRTFELLAHRQFAGAAIFILEFFNKSFVIRTITKAQK